MGALRTVAAAILLTALGLAVTFEVRWPPPIGPNPRSLYRLPDGGYFVCGTGYRSHQGSYATLVRTDSFGNITWTRELPRTSETRACPTGGGYATAVSSHYDSGLWYLDVDRVSLDTDTVISCSLQLDISYVEALAPTSDSGVVVATSYRHGYITKFNAAGQMRWNTRIGPDYAAFTNQLHQTGDCGFIAVGSHEDSAGTFRFFAARLNPAGHEIWFNMWRFESLAVRPTAVLEKPDRRFVCAGIAEDTALGTAVAGTVTLDSLGTLLSRRVYPNGDSLDVYINNAALTHDGGLALCGSRGGVYLVRVNAQGDTLWTRSWQPLGCSRAIASVIEQTEDRGFIILASLDGAMGLIKTDSLGLVYSGVGELPTAGTRKRVLAAKPNPFRRSVALSGPNGAVEIRDIVGRLVRTLARSRVQSWDGRDASGRACPSGVYTASARDGATVRLVLRR
jgi:hypothetical protein